MHNGRRGRSALGQPKRGRSGNKQDWELDLIRATARRIDTTDRDELEGELAKHLLYLKSRPNIRNPRKFFKTGLRRKALNWARDQQTRRKHFTSLDQPAWTDDGAGPWVENIPSPSTEPRPDNSAILAAIYNLLDLDDRILIDALFRAKGNQTEAAILLGVSRNTVHARIRKIRESLTARGLKLHDGGVIDWPDVPSGPERRGHIAVSAALLARWITKRLGGTQWQILLWVLLEATRRKQRAIRFQWAEIAHALSIHPVRALRAGNGLIRDRLVRAMNGKLQILR